ncbi:MAG: hypothetical protein GX217_05325 [Clostridiaceae bacterium]|nr:hypothetical protein [Clostridiaceae bacterium]
MKCPRCSSENISVQIINEQHYKKGYGCILTILFGVFYWAWLVFKWGLKYLFYISYLIFKWFLIFPVKVIWVIIRKEKITTLNMRDPEFVTKIMRKANKIYNVQKSFAVCQSCGYKWEKR